jgi:hypothetical protein
MPTPGFTQFDPAFSGNGTADRICSMLSYLPTEQLPHSFRAMWRCFLKLASASKSRNPLESLFRKYLVG